MINKLHNPFDSRLGRVFIAFGSGAVGVASMPPWHIWPGLFIGYSLFFLLLNRAPSKPAALLYGFAFAFGFHLFGLAWIGNALLVDGSDYRWAWPLAVMGLPLILAPFTALGALIAHIALKRHLGAGFLVFVAALSLTEWLRGHLLTGFPWNLAGYMWADILPIAQLAALGGIYFLTFVTLFWTALPGLVWFLRRNAPKTALTLALFGFLSFGLGFGWGSYRLAQHPTQFNDDIIVNIAQPNIAQKDKWSADKAYENLGTLLRHSLAPEENGGKTTLIIWPETALSYYFLQHPGVETMIKSTLATYSDPVYLLSGVLRRTRSENEQGAVENHYYNSLIAFSRDLAPLAVYDKRHLVPFGEYIPFQKYIPLAPVTGFEGFSHGNGPQTLSLPDLPAFRPLICYEVIFPGAAVDHQNKPEWIVTVTNDGWYGDSAGPYQHFVQARFRAIEEGLPVIRSANTGISGIIDPLGRIIARAPLLEEKNIISPLPRPENQLILVSLYVDLLFFLTLGVTFFAAVAFIKTAKNKKIP